MIKNDNFIYTQIGSHSLFMGNKTNLKNIEFFLGSYIFFDFVYDYSKIIVAALALIYKT
jgi:hypothetical protein